MNNIIEWSRSDWLDMLYCRSKVKQLRVEQPSEQIKVYKDYYNVVKERYLARSN